MVKTQDIKGNFVQIPHSFLRDKDLSFEARSLGIYIASLPKNWNVNWEQVAYEIGISYAKVRKLVKELINAGELAWEVVRDENGRFCGKSNTTLNYTKEQNLFTQDFSQNLDVDLDENLDENLQEDLAQDFSQNTQNQTLQNPAYANSARVCKNPHLDFVQQKNKDLKEQRDLISRPRVCARKEKSNTESNLGQNTGQNLAKTSQNAYKIFNRQDLNLNLWQLFENGKKGLKIAQNPQRQANLNPQGLDNAGQKAWRDFVAYRQSLRQFGVEARSRAARKFEEFYAAQIDLAQAVEITKARGWFCFWDKQGGLITGQKTANAQNQTPNPQNFAKKPKLDWREVLKKHNLLAEGA